VHVGFVPEPAHASPQPRKRLPAPGVAVRVTSAPLAKVSVQSLVWDVPEMEQLTPVPVTVPAPFPRAPVSTRRVYVVGVPGSGSGSVV
jgi:hypothetical protein